MVAGGRGVGGGRDQKHIQISILYGVKKHVDASATCFFVISASLIPLIIRLGAMSLSGTSTNARSNIYGCGMVNSFSFTLRSPYNKMSMSMVRGPQ